MAAVLMVGQITYESNVRNSYSSRTEFIMDVCAVATMVVADVEIVAMSAVRLGDHPVNNKPYNMTGWCSPQVIVTMESTYRMC